MSKNSVALHSLSPGKGARKQRKRVGRGNAAGSGRTAGRGEKGQKARSGGKVSPGFEGGQMPLYRRIPKFGFQSRQRQLGLNCYAVVNFDVLERFSDGTVVDEAALKTVGIGVGGKTRAGIKVLGRGTLTKKLTVKVHAVSKAAQARIEELGGTVELLGAE